MSLLLFLVHARLLCLFLGLLLPQFTATLSLRPHGQLLGCERHGFWVRERVNLELCLGTRVSSPLWVLRPHAKVVKNNGASHGDVETRRAVACLPAARQHISAATSGTSGGLQSGGDIP